MDIDSLPDSTDFLEIHGQLAEWSQMECRLPGANIRLEEYPPMPDGLKDLLDQAGIEDSAQGKASWEIHLELPSPGPALTQLEVLISRSSRAAALRDGQALEEMLLASPSLPGQVEVHILSYPSEDGAVPAMLWADIDLDGVGEISISAASDNLSETLKALQSLLPGARLNS